MIKNETKDSDLPCHTMDPPEVVWGGGVELDENRQKFQLRAATVQDCGLGWFR
jgi:hypothetical protein